MLGRSLFYPMKTSVKIALLFVLIWFTGKYSFFYFDVLQNSDAYFTQVMWNLLCLLLAMFIGSYLEKRHEDRKGSTALGDIKSILGGGMVYTVAVSVLIYTYYSRIDPDYNAHQIEMAEQGLRNSFKDPEYVKQLRSGNPEFKVLTEEEIFDKVMENPRTMYTPKIVMLVSLLGMLMLSVLNAIVLTYVFRRLIFRN